MFQESAEDHEKKFCEKFKKALCAYDFVTVFTLWKWLKDSLSKGNVTDSILAIRDFVDAQRREVILRWFTRTYRLLVTKKYSEALFSYKALQICFPKTEEAIHLVMQYPGGYHISQVADFGLRLAKAFFHNQDINNCLESLLPVLDKEDLPEDIEACAVKLRADVLLAQGLREEAANFLQQRIERYEKEERFELAHMLNNRLQEIKRPEVIDVNWHDEEMTFTIENIVFGDEPGKAFTPQQYWTLRLSHGLCKKKCETSVHEKEVIEEMEKSPQVKTPHRGFGERRHTIRKAHKKYPGLKDIVSCSEKRISWQ